MSRITPLRTPAGEREEEDAPLDPAAERLRVRLVRFMIVNLVVVFGTLAVVVGVLLYRNAGGDESTPPAATLAVPAGEALTPGTIGGPSTDVSRPLALAPGERVASMTAEGARVTLLISGPAGDRLLQVDLRDGTLRGPLVLPRTGGSAGVGDEASTVSPAR